MRARLIAALALGLVLIGSVAAQDIDKEISGLTDKLSRPLVAKNKKKVAVVDFVDLQGRPNELGRFLAEQLSVELVNAEGISVVDRANIKSILAEHKLTEEGLVNPENAKKLGQFAGVDAMLIGTITPLDESIVLTVKAVSTDTAEVIAAGKASFKKTSEIQQLLNRMAASPLSGATSGGSSPAGNATYAEADAIATKDVGDLRIILKSIRRVNGTDGQGSGMQWVFEFVNRSLKDGILVAGNSLHQWGNRSLRAHVLDSAGNSWGAVGCNGLALVNTAGNGADPSQISHCINIGNNATGKGICYANDWEGSLTAISATQSARVTLLFATENNRPQGRDVNGQGALQFSGEFVMATGDPEQPRKCSLINLVFDKVVLPKDIP